MITTTFSSHGVVVAVQCDEEALAGIPATMPPGAHLVKIRHADLVYSLQRVEDAREPWVLRADDHIVLTTLDLPPALRALEGHVALDVAARSRSHTFIHAGVVETGGRAIVIPGRSMAGKSTLVYELLRAGATYYSDEYAVIDRFGRVLPYARELSLRDSSEAGRRVAAAALGAPTGGSPLRLGMLVMTTFEPGVTWQPGELSPGQAMLACLGHTVGAQAHPALSLARLRRLLAGAVLLAGPRGEAAQVAERLCADVAFQLTA